MYGKVKHTIRKHIEWATFWYINHDHSMNVCKDVVKKTVNDSRITLPPPLPPLKLCLDETCTFTRFLFVGELYWVEKWSGVEMFIGTFGVFWY